MLLKETEIRVNGLSYHFRFAERDQSLPWLIMLHGFMGSGEQFYPVAEQLSRHVNLCLPDLPGFGKSGIPADLSRFSAAAQVQDWLQILDSGHFGSSIFLHGYSMGGRLALRVAIQLNTCKTGKLSGRVKGLILESSTPGIHCEKERLQRKLHDEELAHEILDDFPGFLNKWRSQPLLSKGKPSHLTDRIQSETNPLGAAASITGFGSGVVEPVWDQLATIDIPVLLLAGESDVSYRKIAENASSLIRLADYRIIASAGHRIHSDNPDGYIQAITSWVMKSV
jgi:2-succinyl-6-hydroxy-2,4-cyclohexadiene-1-carboxylate synthase